MSESPESPESREEDLQFDRAEYAAADGDRESAPETGAVIECCVCNTTILDSYYEINGRVACPGCHGQALEQRTGGSAAGRFVRALALGSLAGAIGFGIYYGIAALSGYQFALIAVLVGFMVGMGVRMGSNRRGGWLYQLMAVGITYLAIAVTYAFLAFSEMEQLPEEGTATSEDGKPVPGLVVADDQQAGEETFPPEPIVEDVAADELRDPEEEIADLEDLSSYEEQLPGGALGVVVGLVALAAFVLALPVVVGFQSILSLVIIGFGLFEAWKLNKRVPFEAAGPFRVGAGRASEL
ncbi:MAG: hypothetical protein GY856_21600 [bacterium]|nr:hypothetical protein [bacterium]